MVSRYASGSLSRESISPEDMLMLEQSVSGWLDTIDAAKAAGMNVVCYDSKKEEDMRSATCRNSRTLRGLYSKRTASAKVVVYCGAMHLSKKAVNQRGKRAAG